MMIHYKSISELHKIQGYPPPEHPLLSLITCKEMAVCSIGNSEFTGDFYIISLKKIRAGEVLYGRTKYDHENGSMYFMKPRQVVEIKSIELTEKAFMIFIHEDYLTGHSLHEEITQFGFFDYETNEAVHLAEREEQTMWDLYSKIEREYTNNEDEYSRDIILTHIDSILKYSQRFYKRQFINRTILSRTLVSKFTALLMTYFRKGGTLETGLPTVKFMASKLNLSPRYLSDLLKQETGKTALEHIHIFLISEAKNLLRGSAKTIAETAYSLGFENPTYFSRLFKKETGISPIKFKEQLLN
jgi:AraC family transcriptional activator of pobA